MGEDDSFRIRGESVSMRWAKKRVGSGEKKKHN